MDIKQGDIFTDEEDGSFEVIGVVADKVLIKWHNDQTEQITTGGEIKAFVNSGQIVKDEQD